MACILQSYKNIESYLGSNSINGDVECLAWCGSTKEVTLYLFVGDNCISKLEWDNVQSF